jgi:DNA polymerase I-like protein with 3'-5' exonuclease and polymerase domains
MEIRRRRKYDWLLNDDLIDVSLARGWLDIAGAADLVKPFRTRKRLVYSGVQPAPGTPPDVGAKDFARPRNPVQLVTTQPAFELLCQQLAAESVLGLDVETTIFHKPRLLCTIQLATPTQNWVIDALALHDLHPIGPLLTSTAVLKVIHNASFEEAVFAENGLAVDQVFDTCVVSRRCHPESDGHRLDQVVARELGLRMDKTNQKADWRKRPLTQSMVEYASLDAEILILLHQRLAGRT